jgi:E3 ubiquitin-protein ligase DOA10
VLLHWVVGFAFMLSISYFASLLRKVIRKKVLAKLLR